MSFKAAARVKKGMAKVDKFFTEHFWVPIFAYKKDKQIWAIFYVDLYKHKNITEKYQSFGWVGPSKPLISSENPPSLPLEFTRLNLEGKYASKDRNEDL